MVEITRITDENMAWFQGMLPEEDSSEIPLQNLIIRLGAVVDEKACGIIAVGCNGEKAQLRWLYVSPDFRNQGIATRLMEEIEKEKKLLGIKWTMALYPSDENGLIMDRLLVHHGFSITAEKSENYGLTYRQMLALPVFKSMLEAKRDNKYQFCMLSDVATYVIRGSELNRSYNLEKHNRFSTVCLKDNRIVGYLMVKEKNEMEHEVSIFRITGNSSVGIIRGLFGLFAENVLKQIRDRKMSADASLSFQAHDDAMNRFVEKTFELVPFEKVWFHIAIREEEE